MIHILVVDDDAALNKTVCTYLNDCGFETKGVPDAQSAFEEMYNSLYDLIVSDIMMPQLDGYALVRGLRDSGNTIPVLMITARDGFQDMQFGFLAGADDYLVKPINVNELVLRINALLRRAQMVADRRQTLGTTTFEFDSFSVLTGGVQTVLPQKEFLLLYKLVSSPGHIFTRQQLMDDIWGIDTHTDPRTVDVHINRLRDRFRENQDFEIITVRGIGYKAERKHEEG